MIYNIERQGKGKLLTPDVLVDSFVYVTDSFSNLFLVTVIENSKLNISSSVFF